MKRVLYQEDGQSMVETGLIVGLISVTAIAVITSFGPQLVNAYQKVLDVLISANT